MEIKLKEKNEQKIRNEQEKNLMHYFVPYTTDIIVWNYYCNFPSYAYSSMNFKLYGLYKNSCQNILKKKHSKREKALVSHASKASFISDYQEKYPHGGKRDFSTIQKGISDPMRDIIVSFLSSSVLNGQISIKSTDPSYLNSVACIGTNIPYYPYILNYYRYITKPLITYPKLYETWYPKSDFIFYILNHKNSILI